MFFGSRAINVIAGDGVIIQQFISSRGSNNHIREPTQESTYREPCKNANGFRTVTQFEQGVRDQHCQEAHNDIVVPILVLVHWPNQIRQGKHDEKSRHGKIWKFGEQVDDRRRALTIDYFRFKRSTIT